MRRDRRSEAFVLELSRSHPAGVICGQATGENRREILRCAQDDEFEEEHRQEWLCHDNCADTRCGTRASLTIRRCAKMTIRECELRFAHTDAAFPRTSSRHSRRAVHDCAWALFERRAARKLRAGAVRTAKILE